MRSKRTKNNALAVQKTGQAPKIADKLSGMESLDQRKEKELKDKQLLNRLRLATTRVKDVERERIWAITQCQPSADRYGSY